MTHTPEQEPELLETSIYMDGKGSMRPNRENASEDVSPSQEETTMRNVTMTCPHCGTKDKAVGDPDEHDQGHSGKWYCFACGSSGTYVSEFTVNTPTEAGVDG
jgi:hypothetical protein